MTKKDITPEMLEKWKDDCRKEFLEEPDSMNLINLHLKWLDEGENREEEIARHNKALLSFYENELIRSGELVCEHCGNNLEVYYTAHCFHCKECKPKIENGELNFFMATKWIENNEEDFIDEDLWDYLSRNEIIKGNDSYFKFPKHGNKEYLDMLEIFRKHYPVDSITMFVSW